MKLSSHLESNFNALTYHGYDPADDPDTTGMMLVTGIATRHISLSSLLAHQGHVLLVYNDTPSNSTSFPFDESHLQPINAIPPWPWHKPVNDPLLRYRYAKFLTAYEKSLLRLLNLAPTREGIQICASRHEQALSLVKSKPNLGVRFDRLVPRWKSGRWKALT